MHRRRPAHGLRLPPSGCGTASLQDFAALQVDEIEKNIAARRNKIFLLMEEVRAGRAGVMQQLLRRRGVDVRKLPPTFQPARPRCPFDLHRLAHSSLPARHWLVQVRRLRIQMRVKGASDTQLDKDLLEKEVRHAALRCAAPGVPVLCQLECDVLQQAAGGTLRCGAVSCCAPLIRACAPPHIMACDPCCVLPSALPPLLQEYPSSIPFFPPITEKTIKL